jgi:hypothetical protein
MALMDLLTVGRSLSEARDRPHRFKLLSGALPKFGKATAQAMNRNFEVAAFPGVGSEAGKEQAGNDSMKTETIAEEQKRATPEPMNAYPVGRWTLNPFKTSSAPTPRQTVQGELLLDKVKPVRNDLSDSDLELVAVKKRPEPAPESVQIESVKVPVIKAKPLLERMRGLFRREK